MAWKKGESGNPGGRPKSRPFADALRMVLAEGEQCGTHRTLRSLAQKLVDMAHEGNMQAQSMVWERVDGKMPTPIGGDDELDPITVRTIITGVPRKGE